VILREDAGIRLWARGRTAAAMDRLYATMPGSRWKPGHVV
jgi:hypothetical protein